MPGRSRRVAVLVVLSCLGLGVSTAASAPARKSAAPKPAPPSAWGLKPAPNRKAPAAPGGARTAEEVALNARTLEEAGAYAQASDRLRQLRRLVPPDADLELALALDDARVGRLDSAAARLNSAILDKAAVDSADWKRRVEYGYHRDVIWRNGRFDGWYWYVIRARAEIALRQRDWPTALRWATACVAARLYSGKDWLLLAIAAGRAGELALADSAAREAAALDATLPEAHYLAGLHAWRAGRRMEAAAAFRRAVARDSAWTLPAVALARSRLPGAAPDSLPATFLHGIREAGMLTSSTRPKAEENEQMETPASVTTRAAPVFPPDLAPRVPKGLEFVLPVLVDERGRAVMSELPYVPPDQLPREAVAIMLGSLDEWRFSPAMKLGRPQRVWVNVQYRTPK